MHRQVSGLGFSRSFMGGEIYGFENFISKNSIGAGGGGRGSAKIPIPPYSPIHRQSFYSTE
jgi:hypothetical protein